MKIIATFPVFIWINHTKIIFSETSILFLFGAISYFVQKLISFEDQVTDLKTMTMLQRLMPNQQLQLLQGWVIIFLKIYTLVLFENK